MPEKIVDVFLHDELVESYTISWSMVHSPLFEQHFIDRARSRMREDGYSEAEVSDARFIVRESE